MDDSRASIACDECPAGADGSVRTRGHACLAESCTSAPCICTHEAAAALARGSGAFILRPRLRPRALSSLVSLLRSDWFGDVWITRAADLGRVLCHSVVTVPGLRAVPSVGRSWDKGSHADTVSARYAREHEGRCRLVVVSDVLSPNTRTLRGRSERVLRDGGEHLERECAPESVNDRGGGIKRVLVYVDDRLREPSDRGGRLLDERRWFAIEAR